MSKATLDNMDRGLLQRHLGERGEAGYRAGQVWEWAARGATGYDEMTNIPSSLRAQLDQEVPFSTLDLVQEAKASDGTVKALFRTGEGHPVEAVLMRYRDGRRSVCLSSQSGCPLTCAFCATGQMRFGRNLTASEILDQALHFRRIEPIDHAVFMGMGEPMLTLDSVLEAARALPDVGITWRRTTISTVGWLPGLRRFVDEVEEPIRLAFSLHAPTDELRSELMPVNERYPARRRAGGVRALLRASSAEGIRRVRDAARGQRPRRAGPRACGPARPEGLQGEPDPVQPDGDVRRLHVESDRGLQDSTRSRTIAGDGEADARA